MDVTLSYALSDGAILRSASQSMAAGQSTGQPTSQRQVALTIQAGPATEGRSAPLNLGLILDHSGSMAGRPLDTVKQAALRLVERLGAEDRLSVIGFDHRAKIVVTNQVAANPGMMRVAIAQLEAGGGTAIDEGIRLGIEEMAKGKQDTISQAMLLTDGENEHGSNERCLKLAALAATYGITINTLGFGNHWNQNVLEQIADAGGGSLHYIERSEDVLGTFSRLFERMQSVGATNAYLSVELHPSVRLAELKPMAQVEPEVIELTPMMIPDSDPPRWEVRLGDVMAGRPRVVLANLYVGALEPGEQSIAQVSLRYDDPSAGLVNQVLGPVAIVIQSGAEQSLPNPEVQRSVLALAKYRQTQIAEAKLNAGDRQGAATMLQTAAQTALQLGDEQAATVLQRSATQLQGGEDLSEGDRKLTRIVSKTILQDPE